MSTISIIALIISFLALVFSYYRFIRNSPKLEIIRLYKSSTSRFTNNIDGLEFSYNGQVYPELSASEFIVANKSYRSIEVEDISNDSPIEIFIDAPAVIHDFHVIKKVGESKIELVRLDQNTIRFDISSMDMGSSLRVKMLCSGMDVNSKIKAKGRLFKANRSISKIKDLKGISIPELISELLDGAKRTFIFSLIIAFAAASIGSYIEFDMTRAEAKILAPEDFFSLKDQFLMIDSLQDSRNAKAMTLIHESKNGNVDSFYLDTVTSHWRLSWWGAGDSNAVKLCDSLQNVGYNVEFSSHDMEYYANSGYESVEKFKNPKYNLLVKEHNMSYYFSLLEMFLTIFIALMIIVPFLITMMNIKSVYQAFKYKNFLSEVELNEIKDKFKGTLIPRLLSKLL